MTWDSCFAVFCCCFPWIFARLLTECKLRFRSVIKESWSKQAPIPIEKADANSHVTYAAPMHWYKTTIRYPTGFFVSNGNLEFKTESRMKISFVSLECASLLCILSVFGSYQISIGSSKASLPKSVVKYVNFKANKIQFITFEYFTYVTLPIF